MIGMTYYFKFLTQVLRFPISRPHTSRKTTLKRYCIISKEDPLPYLILEAINDIRMGKGWIWKGEYYNLFRVPYTVEVLLYTTNGSLRIVQINESGEVLTMPSREEEEYQFYLDMQLSNNR